MGRYDWLYDLKAVTLKEKVVEELARHAAEGLAEWPPPVEGFGRLEDQARYRAAYAAPGLLDDRGLRYALRLARMELEREIEAIDHAMRNEHWRAHLAGPEALDQAWVVVHWLVDLLLAAKEHSGQRLTRGDLVEVVTRVEARLAPSPLGL